MAPTSVMTLNGVTADILRYSTKLCSLGPITSKWLRQKCTPKNLQWVTKSVS